MKVTSPKLHTAHLTANAEAVLRCQTALEQKDKGNYEGAQEVMRPLWKRVGEHPDIIGLHPSVAAEVLLCAGILTGWIGSKNEIKEADDYARDLITESITYYEAARDVIKVAAARSELAFCYWRAGALDEARIMFTEALQKLTVEGNTRANALFGLSVVEWSASRHDDALKILTDNAPLFRKITNHTIKGVYHMQLAMVLRKLATQEKKTEQLKRVIGEYEEADRHFKLARNVVFRAHVKNNIGNVLRELSRFKEAHEYLDHARRLTIGVKDKVKTAQVNESRAQLFIAEGRFAEAESAARSAARSFQTSGRQCFLAEALITQGTALARLHQGERSQFTFQRAIEVAQQAGALNRAGLAALTMIEELDDLSPETLRVAYDRASEWLSESQSPEILRRTNAAARKVVSKVEGGLTVEDADVLLNKPLDFEQEKLRAENAMIKQALVRVNGSVTRAASLLSMSYQKLAYMIETRHRDLIKERSPVRRRSRKND
jgi:tetratricopeptide (TPR) repeat protein